MIFPKSTYSFSSSILLFLLTSATCAKEVKDKNIQSAKVYEEQGDLAMANRDYKEAIVFFEKAFGLFKKSRAHGDIVRLERKVGDGHRKNGYIPLALVRLTDAIDRMKKQRKNIPEASYLAFAQLYEECGVLFAQMGCYALSLQYLHDTIKLFNKTEESTKKVIDKVKALINEVQKRQQLAEKENHTEKDFNPDEAIVHFDYQKLINDKMEELITWSFIVGMFTAIFLNMVFITPHELYRTKLLLSFAMCIPGLSFLYHLDAILVRLCKAPIPLICTKEQIALPSYLKQVEGLPSLFDFLGLHIFRGESHSIIAHSQIDEYLLSRDGLTIILSCFVNGEAEEYWIVAENCKDSDRSFANLIAWLTFKELDRQLANQVTESD